ncbi:metallophosphoesterase family protein [Rhodohalobacter sp. 8-1]|uniref:metallophosphoesterase family protein n=1 Tax=Rhodohalobacter sp. 8-1 TaxID=3131972 RepID=UPI0030EE59E3
MNILATADLHLGRQSSNLEKGLRESSVAFTLNRLVDYAIREGIDALLLAGDVVDRDNRYYEAVGQLQQAFGRLGEAGIPVVMVAGNHDYDVLPDIVKNREYDHVYLLGEKGDWEAKTINTKNGDFQAVGWSFPTQHVMDDPLLQLKPGALNLDPNLPALGLLHGDLYDQKSQYAPLDMSGFPSKGIQAWVIGHIHKPDLLKAGNPMIFYPGSPQALSSKEPGAHGASILTLDGRSVASKRIILSPVRYDTLHLDVSGIEDKSQFRTRLTERMDDFVQNQFEALEHVSYQIFDVELTGYHPDLTELENWTDLADQLEQRMEPEVLVSVRKVTNLAKPAVENLEELAQQPTPPGLLAKLIIDLESGSSSELLESLIANHREEHRRANRSATYQPLNRFGDHESDTEEASKELLLRESRQLLSELLSQKEVM